MVVYIGSRVLPLALVNPQRSQVRVGEPLARHPVHATPPKIGYVQAVSLLNRAIAKYKFFYLWLAARFSRLAQCALLMKEAVLNESAGEPLC